MQLNLQGINSNPDATGKHGYSKPVLVMVKCPSGITIYDIDKFDTLSATWEKYDLSKGYHVEYWFELP